jgi:hypothetical protein
VKPLKTPFCYQNSFEFSVLLYAFSFFLCQKCFCDGNRRGKNQFAGVIPLAIWLLGWYDKDHPMVYEAGDHKNELLQWIHLGASVLPAKKFGFCAGSGSVFETTVFY